MSFSLRRKKSPVAPQLRWAQDVLPYSGPLITRYREALGLLREGQKQHEASESSAKHNRRAAAIASVLTTILAAAAGITVLPESVQRWVAAALAFCAALVAGITAAFSPARRAITASSRAVRWLQLRNDVNGYLRWVREHDGDSDATHLAESKLVELQARSSAILSDAAAEPAVASSP